MTQIIAATAGFICGVLSGFGVGGGTLLMIYMVNFASIAQNAAQGINLLYFVPTSLTALYSHIKNKLIDWKMAVPAIISGLVFTLVSAFIATTIDVEILKKFFGAFLVLVGCYEFFKKG